MRVQAVAIAAGLLLSGCAGNPYRDFYQAYPGATPEKVAERREAPPPEEPDLFHGGDPNTDIPTQLADGYAAIGVSSYNGPRGNDKDAQEQGKAVGADRVIVYAKYSRTVQAAVPFTLPTSQTAFTNGSATAFGTGGMATAFGSSTTTVYGTQTEMVPISIDKYDFLAVYLVKVKGTVGIFARNLNTQEAQRAGSVNGIVLVAVVHGSPAAAAGLLPGDVISKIDGRPVLDQAQFSEVLKQPNGHRMIFSISRNGESAEVPVSVAGDTTADAGGTASAVQWHDPSPSAKQQNKAKSKQLPSADDRVFRTFNQWQKHSSNSTETGN